MSALKEQAAELLAAGERDLQALQLLNQTGQAPHEVIGFHAQQAAEKCIKALLVLRGIFFERTHDLVLLYRLAEQQGVSLAADVEQLRALNSYAVQFRYESCRVALMSSQACEEIAGRLHQQVLNEFTKDD
ncbi:MAG: HEPN domain-containing protein [Halochromatium sp.]|uniref:HEPN domain-containing protein n=1 Tax=Halochromatium sp. TaxID=2049430 RepID=UPI00397931E2